MDKTRWFIPWDTSTLFRVCGASHRVHTDVHSSPDRTDRSPSLCRRSHYSDSYTSADSWHQTSPRDTLAQTNPLQRKNSQRHDVRLLNIQTQHSATDFKSVVSNVAPVLQCSPVQPRPQVQLPLPESHNPPLLQLQRWSQSGPNQPEGQPEAKNTHFINYIWKKTVTEVKYDS